jgi:hypothetical protein
MAENRQNGHDKEDVTPAESERRGRAWVKRPLLWAGTLATAVVTAVAITLANHFAGNAISGVSPSRVPSGSSRVPYGPYIAVRHEAGFSGGCGSWIVNKPPQDVSPPPSNADWERWVSQNHAIDASPWFTGSSENPSSIGASNLDVTIQGRTATPVILTGIQFIAIRRSSGIIHGGVITNPCGGPMEARYIEVNLDKNPIEIVASHRDPFPALPGEPWLAKPIRFPYYVTATNGEEFKIITYGHHYVIWYAKLFWSVDGRNGDSIISDAGKPFETAPVDQVKKAYRYDGHQWVPCANPHNVSCAA